MLGQTSSLYHKFDQNNLEFVEENHSIFRKKIASLQFKLFDDSEIIRFAEFPLTNSKLRERETGLPAEFGALDPRLGTSRGSSLCQTCHKNLIDCPGHYAYIKLFLPIFHVGHFKKIVQILQSICKRCGQILLSKENLIKFRKAGLKKPGPLPTLLHKLKTIVDECKKAKRCFKCNYPVGKLKKMPKMPTKVFYQPPCDDDDFQDNAQSSSHRATFLGETLDDQVMKSRETNTEAQKNNGQDLNPLKVQELFQAIPREDASVFLLDTSLQSLNELLVEYILVPPNAIRPTVEMGNNQTNEDDLTIKIYEIIKTNNELVKCVQQGKIMSEIVKYWDEMQNLYTQYINSETSGIPSELQKSYVKGIMQRLKGKTGRFRGNLSGKRVEFSARSVITPDPNLRIDQVVVPLQMARILTFGEVVGPNNFKRLQRYVKNGPEVYPGANHITLAGQTQVSLAFGRNRKVADALKFGDIVHRHLIEDDIVLFNRQPSLHKMSIMAFYAKVQPWRTLRFNECVCSPFNADFDGDEMNLHLPQTQEARAEAIGLMGSLENIISPKNGDPLITLIQDFLTCAFILTNKDQFFDRSQMCQICSYFGDANERIQLPPPAIIKPIELWTGKQVISTLLSPSQNIRVIVNIEVLEKCYDKGAKLKHLDLSDGYVCFRNSELISGNLGKATLGGSKDGLIYTLVMDNSRYVTSMMMSRFSKLSARWFTNFGMTMGLGDVTPADSLTLYKQGLLENKYKECDGFIQLFKDNKLELRPGCNAEQTLEAEMTGVLNQIREDAGNYCFKNLPKDNSALRMAMCGSKGSNMNLSQMIACLGQQTVSGKRVPDGFNGRSLPHFEVNSKVPQAKGFVSSSFYTGLKPYEFFFHTMGGREGLIDTAVKTADTGYMQRRLIKALEDVVVGYDLTVRNSEGCILQFMYGDDGMDPLRVETDDFPFNLKRMYDYTISKYPLRPKEKVINNFAEISDKDTLVKQEAYFKKLVQNHIQKMKISKDNFMVTEFYNGVLSFFEPSFADQSHIVSQCDHLLFSERQLAHFFERLQEKSLRARAVAGDGVGALTAQSIGEPCTQMTLKTFHFAGISSMNVTLGIPRMKEIINANNNITTPIIEVILENNTDALRAQYIKNQINVIRIKDIALHLMEVYEPGGCYLELKLNMESIQKRMIRTRIQNVRDAILGARLKLKEKHLKIVSEDRLKILSYETSERELIFIFKNLKNKLGEVIVGGIPTIRRALIGEKEVKNVKHLQIYAEGVGLKEILAVRGVNKQKTQSNHIMEIQEVLGIEAARTKIIEQVRYVMGRYSIHINIRHINVLADLMTSKGKVNGITRYGIARMRDSALMLASFEKTADVLFDAAYFSKKDDIKGVSEKIIIGDMMRIGTGHTDVKYDFPIKEHCFVDQALLDKKPLLSL